MSDQQVGAQTAVEAGAFEGRARATLATMEALRQVLERALEDAKGAADGFDPARASQLIRDTAKAVIVAVEAEGKADHARRIRDGGGGLDLDAARDEIGRRLARLRCAASAG